jgi:hypothetical protein
VTTSERIAVASAAKHPTQSLKGAAESTEAFQGFRYLDESDMIEIVDGTEKPVCDEIGINRYRSPTNQSDGLSADIHRESVFCPVSSRTAPVSVRRSQ